MIRLIALACLAVWLSACNRKPPPAAEIRPVRTVVATLQSEGEPVTLTGHIRAHTEENLAFRIDGRMLTRRVNLGQELRPGDLVAELDRKPQEDALRTTQALLAAAVAALHEANNNFQRQQTLVNEGWSTHVEYDAAQKTLLTARASVDAAAAQVHNAEDQLGYTQLSADAAGVVIATGAEPGEVVRAGQAIVTVAQHNGLDAVFDVPDSLMRRLRPDVTVTVALTDAPNIWTTGHVRETSPQADPVTRSFLVKIELNAPPAAMRLGATVLGQAHMVAERGFELPATALTTADNKPVVWVVDTRTHEVVLRAVTIRRGGSDTILVSDGLKDGERVVTAGVHALRPGQKVRLLEDAS
ncbi:MAG TPA: efflux RND transporter periplasmic adaptor subunit [Acetobacteraceae bacterium]|jgi:membrane fusion protein, multidrug efflux system|nr:efflux RND transporter periplasmic adaptor subunit [Acetobacteraceae bacterium]